MQPGIAPNDGVGGRGTACFGAADNRWLPLSHKSSGRGVGGKARTGETGLLVALRVSLLLANIIAKPGRRMAAAAKIDPTKIWPLSKTHTERGKQATRMPIVIK